MQTSNATRYSEPAIFLHWLVAGLLVVQFVLAELAEQAGQKNAVLLQLALLANHKSVGITIFGLVVVRLLWRWQHKSPELPGHMPKWQILGAGLIHRLFYVLLFALPFSGWLMSSAAAYSVSWFNLFTLPDLVVPDEALKERLIWVHEVLATALFVLAVVHVLAAFKHLIVDRYNVLTRMFSYVSFVLALTVVLMTVQFMRSGGDGPGASSDAVERALTPDTELLPLAETVISSSTGAVVDLPVWQINYEDSEIAFHAEQAGAQFKGVWTHWDADIRFATDQLAASQAVVRIHTGRVATEDTERDTTIVGGDFFDAEQYPIAEFQSRSFVVTESGYQALGTLTIKGISQPVKLDFTVTSKPDGVSELIGTARLDRLLFNVGSGDWASTEWVGQYVDVHVRVTKQL